MSGNQNLPTSAHQLAALLKKLEHDPDALEIVTRLIEKLAALPKKRRRSIHSK